MEGNGKKDRNGGRERSGPPKAPLALTPRTKASSAVHAVDL